VELDAAQLDSYGVEQPDSEIGTVSFRIFYPCEKNSSQRPVKWIPTPQNRYGAAYAGFLGMSDRISEILRYV
jgi:platelet-activating factor acetylhydrolase